MMLARNSGMMAPIDTAARLGFGARFLSAAVRVGMLREQPSMVYSGIDRTSGGGREPHGAGATVDAAHDPAPLGRGIGLRWNEVAAPRDRIVRGCLPGAVSRRAIPAAA